MAKMLGNSSSMSKSIKKDLKIKCNEIIAKMLFLF